MLHSETEWRVDEPSFVTYRREPPASRTVRFETTCRSKVQPAPASDHSGARSALAPTQLSLAPPWCKVAHQLIRQCLGHARNKRHCDLKPKRDSASRASVTFPSELYEMLEAIARSKKVAVAGVVHDDATERYVAEQWPLLGKPQ